MDEVHQGEGHGEEAEEEVTQGKERNHNVPWVSYHIISVTMICYIDYSQVYYRGLDQVSYLMQAIMMEMFWTNPTIIVET